MSSNPDDFWYENDTSFSVFSFDDDTEDIKIDKIYSPTTPKSEDTIFNSNVETTNNLPIHSLISKRNLDIILDEIKLPTETNIPPVEETIKKMFLRQKYVLTIYRTFKGKMELLDAAVSTWDGDIIIQVVIYLSKSLKKQIFLQQILKRKLALKHYIYYLAINKRVDDLADLYMFSGCSCFHLKDLFYFAGKDTMNKERLLLKLEQFMTEHVTKFNTEKDKVDIVEYMKFLRWQIDKKQSANSVTEQLAILYKNELSKNKSVNCDEINQFRKLFKISDFQVDWIQVNVLASLKLWKGLSESFIVKSNWLMQRNTLKSCIKQELFIVTLHKHDAPKSLLEEFLSCVTDDEKSLYLARKMKCYKFVIDAYIGQRDRIALINYKSEIPQQNTDLLYLIDHALRSTDKKWKN